MLLGVKPLLSPEPAARAFTPPTRGVAANGADRAVCGLYYAPLRQAGVVILALIAVYHSATW
jgi:hypothetical protein